MNGNVQKKKNLHMGEKVIVTSFRATGNSLYFWAIIFPSSVIFIPGFCFVTIGLTSPRKRKKELKGFFGMLGCCNSKLLVVEIEVFETYGTMAPEEFFKTIPDILDEMSNMILFDSAIIFGNNSFNYSGESLINFWRNVSKERKVVATRSFNVYLLRCFVKTAVE